MEDINEIHERIMRNLEDGPALILEIAESIEKDTLQTQTITDYFVSKGEIKKTQRKFGSSPVYYLDKDKNKALDILTQTLNSQEKSLIMKIKEDKVIDMELLSPAERYLSQNLTDFIKKVSAQDDQSGRKSDYIYEQGLGLDDVKKIINGKNEKQNNEKTPPARHDNAYKLQKNAQPPDTTQLLKRNDFENPKKIEDDVFLCDYGRQNIKVVVQIIKKKSLGKKEFINAMGYASIYKTIAFIITNAQKIASTKTFGNMITIIKDEI